MSRPKWKIKGLDPGIREAVWALRREGIETVQSCQGGEGHSFPEPTVRFVGDRGTGFRALEIALRPDIRTDIGLPLDSLCRTWGIVDGEPTGPIWELRWLPEASGTHGIGPSDSRARPIGVPARSSGPPDTADDCDRPARLPESPCGTPDPSLVPADQRRAAPRGPVSSSASSCPPVRSSRPVA